MSSNRPHTYEVVVGNVGSVYVGPNWKDAMDSFTTYRQHSIDGYGRAAGEPVTLLRDNEIEQEHIPKSEHEEESEWINDNDKPFTDPAYGESVD